MPHPSTTVIGSSSPPFLRPWEEATLPAGASQPTRQPRKSEVHEGKVDEAKAEALPPQEEEKGARRRVRLPSECGARIP